MATTFDPPLAGPCVEDAQCDDGLFCTFDTCDPALARCRNTPDASRCEDKLYCNGPRFASSTGAASRGPSSRATTARPARSIVASRTRRAASTPRGTRTRERYVRDRVAAAKDYATGCDVAVPAGAHDIVSRSRCPSRKKCAYAPSATIPAARSQSRSGRPADRRRPAVMSRRRTRHARSPGMSPGRSTRS